ncbi:hypothetical protein T08_13795, partial [Trichinella sp. T8]
DVREAEEEEVPAESRTILGEPSTATAIGAEEISATGPVRADTAAQQMICRIGQWCVWPQDYHSIPAPQCWTDTLMDLMIEQIVLQRYPDGAGVSVMSCSAVSAALHHEISAEFAVQVMSSHDASLFRAVPVNEVIRAAAVILRTFMDTSVADIALHSGTAYSLCELSFRKWLWKASMRSTKTPALKSGRRRGKEVNIEGQTERMERRRGSRNSTSATDLGTRMVTRGRKKLMEALVREAVHHEEASTSGVDVDVVKPTKKITGRTAHYTRRAPSGDGERRSSGPSGATCGQADSYSGNAVTDRAEAKSRRSPNIKPTTSSSPRTPKLSKRGARSKIPSTPETPSTSGGSGKQRVLVSLLLVTEELPDLEVLQRTEEQVTVRATFPIAQAVICPLGCEKPYTAVRPDGQFAHQTLTRH